MFLFQKSKGKVSSRQQIQIKEVKDDILILPNHEYRIVVETTSINFELKSEEEQDVLIDSFQNFLNSLPSPIQILIRVREVDIDSYLAKIAKSKTTEKEKVYKDQLDNYCEFIGNLVLGSKILSRRFYNPWSRFSSWRIRFIKTLYRNSPWFNDANEWQRFIQIR